MTMEKEQEMQEWNHVQMNPEMTHHHHDHVKYDQVQYGQEQKQCDNTQFDTLSISDLVRGVCGIKRQK